MFVEHSIESVISRLRSLDVSSIFMQVPDGLKPHAWQWAERLEKEGYVVSVHGAGVYGSCDLPVNTRADAVLHIGHPPIPGVYGSVESVIFMPVYRDFSRRIPPPDETGMSTVGLVAISQYIKSLDAVKKEMEKMGYHVKIPPRGERCFFPGQVLGCDYSGPETVAGEVDGFVLLAEGDFHAVGLLMRTHKPVYVPGEEVFDLALEDRILRKRFGVLARAGNGSKAVILLSQKPGQKRDGTAAELKRLLNERYEVLVVELDDVRKDIIENFNADFYISTVCPRVALDDAKIYEKPILTPHEAKIMLGLSDEYEWDVI